MDRPSRTTPASGSRARRGTLLLSGAALAVSLLACGADRPAGPRLTLSELEAAVRERASELWDAAAFDLTEAWPGERHTFEVVCRPNRATDRQLVRQELMPYEIEFAVTKRPPGRSGVTVAVESSWSRELVFRDRYEGGGGGHFHELLVEVSVSLADRVRLPEDEAVWVGVSSRNTDSGFWVRLYGLGQGRVVIEVPADKRCPAHPSRGWWFN